MRDLLGQPVVVENVTGAAGSIGTGRAARAAPDGYTLSLEHFPSALNRRDSQPLSPRRIWGN
jgi:tripartite-type tricarboxylate transporter receptor subunit TctC